MVDSLPAPRGAMPGLRATIGPLRASYREAGLRDVEIRLYPGGRHEMLHELNRREVIDDVCSWLSRRLDRILAGNGG